jgi:hypothetical protein
LPSTTFIRTRRGIPWLRRISPFSFTQGGRDRNAGGNDLVQVSGIRLSLTRQGFVRADRIDGFETWAGQRFDRGSWRLQASGQLYLRAGVTLQPSGRFSQALTYRHVAFDRASTGDGLRSRHHLQPNDVSVGYGSLIERREYADGEWVLGRGEYASSQRGLFFKASYLHRF